MDKITKAEFLDAILLVRMYVEQEQLEFDNLKRTAAPFVDKNLSVFIDNLNLSTRAYNILATVCQRFFRPEDCWKIPAYRISEIPVSELKKARNSGKTTVSEIESALLKHRISLKY